MNCLTSRWLKECVKFTLFSHNHGFALADFVIRGAFVRFPLN